MEIAYTLLDKDIVLFLREYSLDRQQTRRRRGPYGRAWIRLYYFSLLVVPLSIFVFVAWIGAGYDIAAIAGFSTGVGWRWPLNLLWYHWQKSRACTSPQFLGSHLICISPKGISDQRPSGEWTLYWSQVTDIRETKNFFLFLYQNEAVTPVPHRAFGTAKEAERFYQTSREHWKQSVWPPSPRPGA